MEPLLDSTGFFEAPTAQGPVAQKASLTIAALLVDIQRLEDENTALRKQLRIDRLTGIYNDRALEEYVAASRYEGYYVFADGDGMGALNKTLGHEVVNEYIHEFGTWLRAQVRYIRDGHVEYDGVERRRTPATADAIAVRKHGDEFLVWCSNKRGALRIRNAIRNWRSSDGRVTFSAGLGKDLQTADMNCSDYKKERKTGLKPPIQ